MVLPLIFSALAPSVLAGTGMSATLASALGAGLGGVVQTGDLEKGILTGLGAFAGGSIAPMLAGGAGATPEALAAAVPAGQKAIGQGANAMTALAPGNAGIAGLTPDKLLPPKAAMASSAAPTGIGSLKNIASDAFSFAKSPAGKGAGIGATIAEAAAPMILGGGDDRKGAQSNRPPGGTQPIPREVVMPGTDYMPGISPEFNYGVSDIQTPQQLRDFAKMGAIKYSDGGLLRRYQQMMGPVKMAEGGIASLAEMDDVPPPAPQMQGGNEKTIISDAVSAIKGQNPNPEVALAVFLQAYGEEALRDLVDRVTSGEYDQNASSSTGKMSGPGDGMEDLIPANIEGEKDVLLSDGEYVVPADVVSGLGNGSTDAGARTLDKMADRVRMSRTGTSQQPSRVPQNEVLPA